VVNFTPRPLYSRNPLDGRLGGSQRRSGCGATRSLVSILTELTRLLIQSQRGFTLQHGAQGGRQVGCKVLLHDVWLLSAPPRGVRTTAPSNLATSQFGGTYTIQGGWNSITTCSDACLLLFRYVITQKVELINVRNKLCQ
jgi:hypothetical protein